MAGADEGTGHFCAGTQGEEAEIIMKTEVCFMGWFKDKYGDDAHPILPAEEYSKLYDEFGETAANETLQDVQDGKISVDTLKKYLHRDEKK